MPKSKLTPEQQKKILFGVGIGVGLVIWLQFVLLPQQRRLGETRAELQLLRGQLNRLKAGLVQRSTIEGEIDRLKGEFQLPANPKPPEQQLPDLLEEITKAARRAGVQVVGQKPQSELDRVSPGASGYLEIPLFIEIVGGYHSIGQFLNDLENSSNLLQMRELGIVGEPENLYRHRAVVIFQAYLVPGTASGHGST